MSLRWMRGVRWVRHTLYLLLLVALAAAGFVAFLIQTGAVERWARKSLIHQVELRTGTRVALNGFHLHLRRLRVELDGLTLHGLEPSDVAPLFYAKRVDAEIRVVSFFQKKIALDEFVVDEPEVAVRIDKNGRSNVPQPKVSSGSRPWRETLFDLQIGHLELRNGSAFLNNRSVPLALLGRNFQFQLHFDAADGGAYAGSVSWEQGELSSWHDAPFRFDLVTKFTLHRDAFEIDQLICKLPHSEIDVRAQLTHFAQPDWTFQYRGRLSLDDVRAIARQPEVPSGIADFSGRGEYAAGEWKAAGHYAGRDVQMRDMWYHAAKMESWGDYEIANGLLTVPNLGIRALGGSGEGRLEMKLASLEFHTETRLHGLRLAAALAAVDNIDFPVDTLHWDGLISVNSVNTWTSNFKHFRTRGTSQWEPPETSAPGTLPVSAHVIFDYSMDRRNIEITQSQIATPKSTIDFDGTLGAVDSALELKLQAGNLKEWDDFINDLRGPDSTPDLFGGAVAFRGRIMGPLGGPTFVGHIHAADAHYDQAEWDELDGGLEYSPDLFELSNTLLRRGTTSVTMNLTLQFDGNWGFVPGSRWNIDARAERASTADLQAVLGTKYPVSGLLSGDFKGGGTRASPNLDANFSVDDVSIKGMKFDRLSGDLHAEHDEWKLSQAELLSGSGRVAGEVVYHPQEQTTEFQITGEGISLENIETIQNPNLPVTGRLDFELRGNGPVHAPAAQGDFRVTKIKFGSEMQGNLTGRVVSDGQRARFTLSSEMLHGDLHGDVLVGLAGDEPLSGEIIARQIDMDPFIVSGLHLKQLTGHSSVDGEFHFSGSLLKPETIEVTAEISQISFNYEFVQLQNDGPVKLSYRRNEVRIDQAHLHGPNTDLQLNGSARFDRDRPLHFNMAGNVDLRIAKGLLPDLEAQGRADVNVSVEGTISKPRITGRVSVRDASATYADFPAGLSHVNGDIVFDRSRLLFDHVTAESGGGQLTLDGSISYGEGPLRYEINAVTPQVRIRYPAGMSWLAGGKLQLSGTSSASILSGQVEVKRVLFAEGVDIASLFASASDTVTGPAPSSPFLRNLSFDIAVRTSPGARIEWTRAHVDIDGDLRLRGNWERPILLGHIHLLGGEMAFRGNNYQLTRGDINFASPFRLDPELNIEATTLINQYQVTINFSGHASRLSLNYRSDPPLPDSDIIALLAIGSTGEESALRSSNSSSQNYGATALLSEAISSGLGGRIERLFGITHFRVDPFLSGTATESNAAARITIQQQVTRDLNVTYSSNTSASQYQLIQVEYAVRRDLSIVFLRDINGTYGFDIKFVKHFK